MAVDQRLSRTGTSADSALQPGLSTGFCCCDDVQRFTLGDGGLPAADANTPQGKHAADIYEILSSDEYGELDRSGV